jgi:hypothetical protein
MIRQVSVVILTALMTGVRSAGKSAVEAWHQFWFQPADPLMIGVIRALTGWMLFYNLAVWTLDLEAFFGDYGLQPLDAVRAIYKDRFVFSFWLWLGDDWLWPIHFLCLAIAALFCVGLFSRVMSVLSFLITISYSQRVPIANFGFDQILGLLCLYLCLAPSGAAFSVDALLRKRRQRRKGQPFVIERFSSARMAMRLIQLHLCAIYLWAGLSKLKGPSWWTGEALWRVIANEEYQTFDLTWMAWVPWLPFVIAHITIAWEVYFIASVWHPRLRPLVLTIGVFMHLGIGAFFGMWTFGLIMTFAYLAFSDPELWRRRLNKYFQPAVAADAVDRVGSQQGGTRPDDSDGCRCEQAQVERHPQCSGVPAVSKNDGVHEHNVAQGSGVLCLVCSNAAERSSLRRFLQQNQIVCRLVNDFEPALTVLSRYRCDAVVVLTPEAEPKAILEFAEDVHDLAGLPLLLLLSRTQQAEVMNGRLPDTIQTVNLPVSRSELQDRLLLLTQSFSRNTGTNASADVAPEEKSQS